MRKYKNSQLIVYWFPELCAHPSICVKLLPKVFDPDRRPWVDINAAEPEEIIRCIDRCPSGALQCSLPGGSSVDPVLASGAGNIGYARKHPASVRIRTCGKGPMTVEGPVEILNRTGEILKTGSRTVLCCCGRSCNSPFCDGSHKKTKA